MIVVAIIGPMQATPLRDAALVRDFRCGAVNEPTWRIASGTTASTFLPIAAGTLFFVVQICRYVVLFRGAEVSQLVGWLPDDAFYYLIPGRNFAQLHRWTFDGIAPATGFHLLWAYTIAAIYWLVPNISFQEIFRVLFFGGSLVLAASLAITCSVVLRLFGTFSLLAPVAVFLTSMTMQQPNFLMESTLVVFFSSVSVWIVTTNQISATSVGLALAFGVGLLGMLSRSDFGLLPLNLLVASAGLDHWAWTSRVKRASGLLAGSLFGLALVLAHTYIVSGHLIQSSARVKQHWAMLDDTSIIVSAWYSLSPLTGTSPQNAVQVGVVLVLTTLVLFLAIYVVTNLKHDGRLTITPAGAMGFVVLSYIAFYKFDGNFQPWYLANYVVPYSVLGAGVFALPRGLWKHVSAIALATWACTAPAVRKAWSPTWPQQVGFYRAGIYLRDHPEFKPVAAWNCGIQSYVAGGGVINLDGLVNEDVVPHVLSNSLRSYLAEKHLYRVLDDAIMWNSSTTREHGEYAGDSLTRCVRSNETVWEVSEPRFVGDHIVFTELEGECVRRGDTPRTEP